MWFAIWICVMLVLCMLDDVLTRSFLDHITDRRPVVVRRSGDDWLEGWSFR